MKNNKGFSLVELIVVIAIMAILAAVAVIGVSVYIPKAQQASDKQLVSDISYGLNLHYQGNPDEMTSGYVIITTEGTTAVGSAEEALKALYGDEYKDLKLAYDGWTSNSAMLSAALNATNVNSSSYIQNSSVSELLGNVQDVTSAAAGLLGSVSKSENHYLTLLETSMGEAYMEKAVSSGVIGKNEAGYYLLEGTYTLDGSGNVVPTEALQNQLSNLMVFGVADQMKNVQEDDMVNMMISGMNSNATVDNTKYSTATIMAAQYALYKAYAADVGGDAAEDFAALNESMYDVDGVDEAKAALEQFVGKHSDGLTDYIADEERLGNNANAVSQIMNGVTAVSPNYTSADTLNNSGLFTSNTIAGDLNVFVGVTSVELNDTQIEEIQSILSSHPNAVVVLFNNGEIISTVD